jgi:hypothetical protein
MWRVGSPHFAHLRCEIPSQFELRRFVRERDVENAENDLIKPMQSRFVPNEDCQLAAADREMNVSGTKHRIATQPQVARLLILLRKEIQ